MVNGKKAQAAPPVQKSGSGKRVLVLLLILVLVFYIFLAKYSGINLPGGSFLVGLLDSFFYAAFLSMFTALQQTGITHSGFLTGISSIIVGLVLLVTCFFALKSEKLQKFSLIFVLGFVSSILILVSATLGKLIPTLVDYINAFGKIAIGIIGILLALQLFGAIGLTALADLFNKEKSKAVSAVKLLGLLFGAFILYYSSGFIVEAGPVLQTLPGMAWLGDLVSLLSATRTIFWVLLIGGPIVFVLKKIPLGKYKSLWSSITSMGSSLAAKIRRKKSTPSEAETPIRQSFKGTRTTYSS